MGVALLAAVCLGLGWWVGQLQQGAPVAGSRPALELEVSELQQLIKDGKAKPTDQQRLLELLVALDRRLEATPLLETLADQDPEKWTLRLLLAEVRRDQNDPAGAERELRQLLSQRPNQVEALQLMALLQLEAGRGEQAQALVQASLKRTTTPSLKPEALPIGLVLAQVLERRGFPGKAEAELIRLATRFPDDPRPLLARAMLQHERGQRQEAMQSLNEARTRQTDPKAQQQLDRVAAAWGMQVLKDPESDRIQQPPRASAGSESP